MSMIPPSPAPVAVSTVAGQTLYTCTYCEVEITADEAHALVLKQDQKTRAAQVMTTEHAKNHADTRAFFDALGKGIEKQLGTWFNTVPEKNTIPAINTTKEGHQ